MMEKRNIVEVRRTPTDELDRKDAEWDKEAAEAFKPEAASVEVSKIESDKKE